MFRFQRSLQPGWIACVPSGARAHFARVERPAADAPPAVRWLHEESWDDATRALRAARRAGGLARHACVGLLPREQVQLLPMDAPDVPREEWRAALRWKLKDMVDFPVEDAGVDLLEVPTEASSRRQPTVIAVAARGDALRSIVRAAEDAGVRWRALDVAETGLRNLSALLATPGRGHALLHVGDSHATLVITHDGELLQTRQIDVTAAQVSSSDEAVRQAAYDRAGLELQRTLDGFERVFTQTSLERLHLLPGSGAEPFADYVRELVYVPVLVADLAAQLDLSAVPAFANNDALAPYWVAIGAALRSD